MLLIRKLKQVFQVSKQYSSSLSHIKSIINDYKFINYESDTRVLKLFEDFNKMSKDGLHEKLPTHANFNLEDFSVLYLLYYKIKYERPLSFHDVKKAIQDRDKDLSFIPYFPFDNIYGVKKDKILTELPTIEDILEATISEDQKKALQDAKMELIKKYGDDLYLGALKEDALQKKYFDKRLRNHLTGEHIGFYASPYIKGYWQSMMQVLPDFTNFRMLNHPVRHSFLLYQGELTTVADYQGVPSLIAWKRSPVQFSHPDQLLEVAMKLVASYGALNFDPDISHNIKKAYVVVAFEGGAKANVFELNSYNIVVCWHNWLARLQEYYLKLAQS